MAQIKFKQNPIVCISILLPCHLFGLTCSQEGTAAACSLGCGHSGLRLIYKRRESSLVMTEESGEPNLAAFVPLKLLMMQTCERSTWREISTCCEDNLSNRKDRSSWDEMEQQREVDL